MDLVYKDKKQLKKCKTLAKIFKNCNYDLNNLNTIIIQKELRVGFPDALLILQILEKGKKNKKTN